MSVFEQLDRFVEFELGGPPAGEMISGMRVHLTGSPAREEEDVSLRALVASDM